MHTHTHGFVASETFKIFKLYYLSKVTLFCEYALVFKVWSFFSLELTSDLGPKILCKRIDCQGEDIEGVP